jgi:two-component system, chemotaxis family, CheB/CheR fusion protein
MDKSTSSKSTSENNSADKSAREDFLVVGLGASAGGVQALTKFFENVSADGGIAYVVILHLSPDHDSQLASVLQNVSPIPVTQVIEAIKVEPNHVYVVPPNQHLEMMDGHLVVSPNTLIEERRAPVDIFFRTLADSHDSRAVAVILSGTGADGSMGIKRIKEHGGAIFVQNPREAEFNEMPRNAIATELVDEVLPVGEIPRKITAYKEILGTVEIPAEPEFRPDEQQQSLREIFTQLRVRTGHDFSNYKRGTVLRRIERRMGVRGLPDLPSYAQFISENPDEAQALLKDLLISVTNFFRDRKAFEALEKDILPRIVLSKSGREQIRVWVAGCATGEEAYSIAMLLAERTLGKVDAPSVQIFATDIDEAAISAAREGLYSIKDAADVSPERLQRFFTKEGENYRVRRELREMILFAQHNILKDPPFSHLDLVTCRNMLIYFNHTAQERVMETAHFALNPGGFLFIGASESVDGASDLYAPVNKELRIYQSRQAAARLYPVPDAAPSLRLESRRPTVAEIGQPDTHVLERITFGDLHQQLLEQYAPPSVLVNEEYDIVHLSERAGRYMQIAGGEPSNNLLKLIRPELRLELRTALYQAVQNRTNVEAKNLKIGIGESTENLNIHVRPIFRETDTARGFILVLFERAEETQGEALETIVAAASEPVARRLEEELVRTKGQLRSLSEQNEVQIEELRASNEELQAMNEELRAAAEELETSKEELQSVNEELTTVNQELKFKIEELSQTNNNFQNLINSTDIGTIFLDRSFRVQMFTPAAREIFNLIPADIGRPLSDITHHVKGDGLMTDAETVLENLQTIEREVRTTDDRVYTMRVLPYRTMEDRINGVVVTFYDTTERKRMEEAKFFLASIVESSKDSMLTINFNGIITSWNRAAESLYGYTAREAIGKPLTMLTLPEDLQEILSNIQKIKRGEAVEIFDTFRLNKDGRQMHLEIALSPVRDADGQIIGVSTIARDVTEPKFAKESLQRSQARLAAIFSEAEVGLSEISADGHFKRVNNTLCRILRRSRDEMLRLTIADVTFPEDLPESLERVKRLLETGEPVSLDKRYLRGDGSIVWANSTISLFAVDENEPPMILAVTADISERKAAGEELRRAYDELEARVAERTRELAEANSKLKTEVGERRAAERKAKALLRQLISAQEEERRRISRELHDEMGQQLTTLTIGLKSLKENFQGTLQSPAIESQIERLQQIAVAIDGEVDRLTTELRPTALDDLGLIAALQHHVESWSEEIGVKVDFYAAGLSDIRLPKDVETTIYRAVQESLTNIAKHADGARRISIVLERRKEHLSLIIEDDGSGFDSRRLKQAPGTGKLGLQGMRERVKQVGGDLRVESAKKKGTSIFIRIPLAENLDESSSI